MKGLVLLHLCLAVGVSGSALAQQVERTKAAYYADYLHGRKTASGEVYQRNLLTCAHRNLPFGSMVRVRNERNGREVDLKVNDRCTHHDRAIDVSYEAARRLDMLKAGVDPVTITPLHVPNRGGVTRTSQQHRPPPANPQYSNPSPYQYGGDERPIPVSTAPQSNGYSYYSPPRPQSNSRIPANHYQYTSSSSSSHSSDYQQKAGKPLRVQFGAFSNPAGAARLRDRLNAQGFATTIISNRLHYVVTRDSFRNEREAVGWMREVESGLGLGQLTMVRM